MSHAEFAAWLMKIAMGWLGWSERQALDTTIPAILTAYEGRMDMLKAIFGSGEDDKGKPERKRYSTKDPEAMKKLFEDLG
jgi:hypothetical protein